MCLLILNSACIFAEDLPLAISKVALKYQGEDTYRIFEVDDGGVFHHDPSNNISLELDLIATLTEADGLIEGVIVEIKWYGTYAGETGWCNRLLGTVAGVENGTNYLSSGITVDLTSVKRKKVTCRVYGGQGIDEDEMTVAPTVEDDL